MPPRSLDVLVVDDNVDAAEMLKLLLEEAGHRVRVEHGPHGRSQRRLRIRRRSG
jgi:CheY-like chemotaxis protein